MKRILFVDDEPRVLSGIRRMTMTMREDWSVLLAAHGQEALEVLRREPVDVVVSDLRMPIMDGVTLLARVKNEYPHVVRIVLTGQADLETALRSVSSSHQYLAKPIDSDSLRQVIHRACALQDLLRSGELAGVVGRISSLPAMPATYTRLVEAVGSADASMAEVGRILASDVALTAKILQLVNSAFFGLRRRVSSTEQAATLLGLDTIRALVLTAGVFSTFSDAAVAGCDLETLETHSLAVGWLAREVARAERQDPHLADESFMAGTLHDLGVLLLCTNLRDPYRAVFQLVREEGYALCRAEQEVLGADHGAVGAYLVGLWGMPESIQSALAFHHDPSSGPSVAFEPLTTVHVANALDRGYDPATEPPDPACIDRAYLTELGLWSRWPDWQAIASRVLAQDAKP